MKFLSTLLLMGSCILMLPPCQPNDTYASFDYFEYEGFDSTFVAIDQHNQYQNPILSGFYPDPSICRKGGDYYLATSSFTYYPGIPIFHSTDLVNWVQMGHALNRPPQLQVDSGVRLSGGVYAPTIRYNPYNETFYLISTLVDVLGNFIVKTKNPAEQSWSDPIPLSIGGIDPDIFFDDDGKAYIVHNDTPPGKPEWNGHRAIWLHEFDVEKDMVVGEKICVVDGGVDKRQQPIWIEAPHLYKINGYYYLMCAEGGTSDQHSEVIFRSKDIRGKYVPWQNNPILTQRDLPDNRPNPITCAGHADLVETPDGSWYAVFLACRPYLNDYYNTGRETFLLPVKWQNEYPVILEQGKEIPYVVSKPKLSPKAESYKGNFAWRDEFSSNVLHDSWLFIRTPPQKPWWSIRNGSLQLRSTAHSIYEVAHPAFVGVRQRHLSFSAQAKLSYHPVDKHDISGLVCYQSERYNFVFGKSVNEQGKSCIVLNRSQGSVERIAEVEIQESNKNAPVLLKIAGNKDKYSFFASFDDGSAWITVAENVDARLLSTKTAGGFTGVILGLYTHHEPLKENKYR